MRRKKSCNLLLPALSFLTPCFFDLACPVLPGRTRLLFRKVIALFTSLSLIASLSFFLPATPAQAQENTWTVNTTGDTGTGSGMSGDLRYAMTQVQIAGGGAIIFDPAVFNVNSTIELQGPLPAIDINSGTLDVQGPGAELLTISGNNMYRVFEVDSGNVTISDLTIANGRALGGNGANGSDGPGGLTKAGAGVAGSNGSGGAVYNAGTLTVSNITFSNNNATGGSGGKGGRGYSDGTMSGKGGGGGDGGSGGSGCGGAVYNTGSLTISYSTFSGNSATGGSGGLGGDCGGFCTTFLGGAGGSGGSAYGGAVYSSAMLTINSSAFTSDVAVGGTGGQGGMPYLNWPGGTGGQGGAAYGGAVYNTGTLTSSMRNSLFSDNTATGGTGGTGGECNFATGVSAGGAGGAGGNSCGGALYNDGTLAFRGCTFSSDRAAGGNGGLGMMSLKKTGGNGGSGGTGCGGAAFNAGTLSTHGGTFSGDRGNGGAGGSGGSGQNQSGVGVGGNGGNGGNGRGGALYNAGMLDIVGSGLSGDSTAGGSGGAGGLGYSGPTLSSPGTPGTPGSGGSGAARSIYNESNYKTSALDAYLDSGSNTTFGAINIVSVSPPGVPADGTSQVTVTSAVYNAAGAPEQGVSVDITTTLGSLGAPGPILTDASGLAIGTITSGTAGTATVQVQAGGYPSVSTEVTFTAGTPADILPMAGTPQSAQVGTVFGTALQVLVEDVSGNPVSGVLVTFTAPSSGAGGTFANGTNIDLVITDSDGMATASAFTANSIAGSYTVAAGISGVDAPVSFSLTNTTTGVPQISSSTGTNSITPFDQVIISAGGLSAGQYLNYTTNGNITFTGAPSSVSGCVYYQEPFSLPLGTYTVAAAVYTSGTGLWGDVATATFTVSTAVNSDPASGGRGNSPSPPASNNGSATVSPASGGTVSLGSQASINIPVGALQGSTAVNVTIQSAGSPPAPPEGYSMVGAYEFTVDGQDHYNFSRPVTLTFAFDPSRLAPGQTPAVYYYDEDSGRWVDIGGTVSGNTITVTVDHFTKFAVLSREATSFPEPQPAVALTDIAGHWAEKNIARLVEMGAVSGYPDGTFKPDSSITRAEFTAILVKAFKLQGKGEKLFADTADSWARDYISTAAACGIVGGYDENTFGPDDPVTREQMAVMAVKAAKISAVNEQLTFKDSADISAWAREAVAIVVKDGIMKGYPDNTFRPGADATRAEAATIIMNALNK